MSAMVLLLLFAAVSRLAMQWLPEIKAYVETTLADEIGAQVTIERLTGRVEGLYPVFVLRNVTVQAHDEGKAPLTLNKASLAIDWWRSLTSLKPRAKQIWLSGADVHLVVSAQGKVHLRGWDEQEPASVASEDDLLALLQLAYEQQRVVLENISVRFDLPDMPSIETHDLALALVREGRERYLTAAFTAVEEPLALAVRLKLENTASDWKTMLGQVYLRLQGERLERWLPEWPWRYRPAQLSGTLELWGTLQQQGLARVVAALSEGELRVQHREQEGGWHIEDAAFLLSAERTNEGYQAQLGALEGYSAEAGPLALGPVWLSTTHNHKQWAVRGENVSLAGLVRHGQAWPFMLPEAAQQFLQQAPKGDIAAFSVRGEEGFINHFAARFANVAVGTAAAPVSVAGVNGWVVGTQGKALANLEPSHLHLGLPTVFAAPFYASARGAALWQRAQGSWQLTSGLIHIGNNDVHAGTVKLKLHWPTEAMPQLSLQGDIADGSVAAASRYIPLKILPPKVSAWLADAFVSGHVDAGKFIYEGAIRAEQGKPMARDFLMRFSVADTALHVAPGWPNFTEVAGTVDIGITPQGINVAGEQLAAQFLGQHLQEVAFAIHGSKTSPAALTAHGRHQGKVDTVNHLFNHTPLNKLLPKALREWQFSAGDAQGRVALALPLHPQAPPLALNVQSQLQNATLTSKSLGLTATQVSGDVAFSVADGFRAEKMTGEIFGRAVSGRATSNEDITHLSLTGVAPVAALRDWQHSPWLTQVKGELPYQFSLTLPRNKKHQVAWRLYSNLEGTEVAWPAPLRKRLADKQPLNISWRQQASGQALLQVQAERQAQGEFMLVNGQLERGNLRFGGQSGRMPSTGLRIEGNVHELDIATWAQVLKQQMAQPQSGALPLLQLALQANNIRFGDLGDAGAGSLQAHETGTAWNLRMQSERLSGGLWWPKGYQLRGTRPLTADVEELHWPFANRRLALGIFNAEKGQVKAQQMPIADVRLHQLYWQGKDLGGWQAQLRPHAQGTRFAALQGRWQSSRLTGEMDWRGTATQEETTHIKASLSSEKLEDTLTSVGLAGFFESKKANADVALQWQGGPIQFDYRKLYGKAQVQLEKAYLPGGGKHMSALRMLGVLNIGHTLGRRLRLDFSDVVQKGLVVDKLTGEYHLAGPALTTIDLRLDSPSAEFNVAGQLNLNTGALDSAIEVTLPLSSNLYAGCLAGPVACAGVFVVERLWGNRLEKLTSMEYQVLGPWHSPEVNDVNGIYKRKRAQYERFIDE